MSKPNLVNSLFKIDAAEGLVRYTNTVKPYHSKLLDVLIEYIYKEDIRVKVTERWNTDIQQFKPTNDLVWNNDTQQYENNGSPCYFTTEYWDILKTNPAAGGSFIVKRHHRELFAVGAKMLVEFSDGTHQSYTIAEIAAVVTDQSDQASFKITVPPSEMVPDKTAAKLQLQNTPNVSTNVFLIQGHHASAFLPGNRFLATYTDNTSKVFIVKAAENIAAVYNTDSLTTQITIVDTQSIPLMKYVATIQPTYTPDYHIVGALTTPATTTSEQLYSTGDYNDPAHLYVDIPFGEPVPPSHPASGSWIVTGDVQDEFMIGENIIIANTVPTEMGATVYTISGSPTVASIAESVVTPIISYNIVGVTPSHPEWRDPQDHLVEEAVPGRWFIDGAHPDILPGTTMSVTNDDPGVKSYYTVASVTPATGPIRLASTIDVYQVIHGFQDNQRVTLQPSGLWIPDPQSSFYVSGVTDVDHFSVNPPTTVIEVALTNIIPETALPAGIIRNPVMPSGASLNREEVVTIIPVSTAIYRSLTDQPDGHFAPLATGLLRHVPAVYNQIAPPPVFTIGSIWINPVTNVSQRWTANGWAYNYTPTQYAWPQSAPSSSEWGIGNVQPSRAIIISAVSQNADPQTVQYHQTNSFLVDTTGLYQPAEFAVTSTKNNELMFSNAYTITSVDSVANTWTVEGDVSVIPGETIYITSSTSKQGLGKYVVASVTKSQTPTVTSHISVTRQISRLASGDGILTVPTNIDSVPKLVSGTRVKVSSTSTLPSPLDATDAYYFIPVISPFVGKDLDGNDVETPALFVLSRVRVPRDYYDYVDVAAFGDGRLTLVQDEIYVPGSKINIRDSYLSRNNGSYTIVRTANESATTTRVFVAERVLSATPSSEVYDGVMEYDTDSHVFSPLTERTCKSRDQSELNAAARITEYIEFAFTVDNFDFVLPQVLENEPRRGFVEALGFDVPANDTTGFDGDIVYSSPMFSTGSTGTGFVHNVFPIGFDTQYFDVGGIDETTASVANFYSEKATKQWLADKYPT